MRHPCMMRTSGEPLATRAKHTSRACCRNTASGLRVHSTAPRLPSFTQHHCVAAPRRCSTAWQAASGSAKPVIASASSCTFSKSVKIRVYR